MPQVMGSLHKLKKFILSMNGQAYQYVTNTTWFQDKEKGKELDSMPAEMKNYMTLSKRWLV